MGRLPRSYQPQISLEELLKLESLLPTVSCDTDADSLAGGVKVQHGAGQIRERSDAGGSSWQHAQATCSSKKPDFEEYFDRFVKKRPRSPKTPAMICQCDELHGPYTKYRRMASETQAQSDPAPGRGPGVSAFQGSIEDEVLFLEKCINGTLDVQDSGVSNSSHDLESSKQNARLRIDVRSNDDVVDDPDWLGMSIQIHDDDDHEVYASHDELTLDDKATGE